MIYGALLWMADKLQSEQGEQARRLWTAKGKQALKMTEAAPQALSSRSEPAPPSREEAAIVPSQENKG
jgi:hypothetical protein